MKVLLSAGLPAELPHRFSDLPLMLVLPVRILSLRCSFGTDPRPNFVRRSVSNRPKAELSARGLSLFFRNSGQVRRNAVGGCRARPPFPLPPSPVSRRGLRVSFRRSPGRSRLGPLPLHCRLLPSFLGRDRRCSGRCGTLRDTLRDRERVTRNERRGF